MLIRTILFVFSLLICTSLHAHTNENTIDEIDIISLLGSDDEEDGKPNENIKIDEALNNEFIQMSKVKAGDSQENSEVPELEQINNSHFKNFALVRILNKITTKSVELKIAKDKTAILGKLQISMSYCWQSSPEEEQENKAYLNISEQLNKDQNNKIFSAWMLSSSPSLMEMQHPIYDVHLIKCLE